MKAETLIFDVDGTLWDSVALVAEGWNEAMAQAGLEPRCTEDSIRPLFGKTMDEIADALLPEVPVSGRYELMEACMQAEDRVLERDKRDIFYPGVPETLRRLAKHHRICIVSNCQKNYIEILLEKGGIGDIVTDHACFGDTGTCKAETIALVCRRSGIESAVYIGDTQGDLDAAEGAGLPFVWASYGFGSPAHWDARVDSFPELEQLFGDSD